MCCLKNGPLFCEIEIKGSRPRAPLSPCVGVVGGAPLISKRTTGHNAQSPRFKVVSNFDTHHLTTR